MEGGYYMSDFLKEDDGFTVEEQVAVANVIEESAALTEKLEKEHDEERSGDPSFIYNELLKKYDNSHKQALFEYCFIKNIGYIGKLVNKVLKNGEFSVLERYLQEKAKSSFSDVTFFSQLRQENFEKIYSEDYSISLLDEEDKKNRLQVIEILGYDPFAEDAREDQPQLYRDMTGMLTEAMRKDIAKAKAALSVVRGYNNLDKYQRKINEIMRSGAVDEDTQKQLDQYIKVQKTLQDSINQTAEKNNFTVKGIGNSGKGMLSDVLNQIEEKGIDEGIINFYDIATSKSIEEVANISFKAQLNQINLSKTDYADILTGQIKMVKEAQDTARKSLEGMRIAREKVKKQELLDELEIEYKKKGIKEEEIEEFIQREYKMYEV